MNTMVLEVPVMAAPQTPIPTKLQERLTTVYDGVFATLTSAYAIPDPHDVFAFLRSHSELLPVLIEGRAVVSFFFSEETPVTLTLLYDADIGFEYLMAWVQVDMPSSEARDKLLEMSDVWLRTRSEAIGDLLRFNLGAL